MAWSAMGFLRDIFYIVNTRMWQGKAFAFIIAICVMVMIGLYSHFESEISKLSATRRELATTLAQIQWANLDPSQGKVLSSLLMQNESPDLSSIGSDNDDVIIIYNRVPKTGSTSFMGIAYDLCTRNGYNVLHINTSRNSHILSLSDQMRFVQNVTSWSAKKPAIYHGHIAFLDFSRFGISKRPLFINIIRKPLDRLVSYYYFLRYGDDFRPYVVRRRKGNRMSFDECVEKREKDCDPDNMWLQIPFFCGHFTECWVPGSRWALTHAKHNLVQHYFLVGVTEELQDFIALLEASLPRFFHGATNQYIEGKKSHLRKTYNKIEPLRETISKIRTSKVWQMENEFYEFVLQHFHMLRKRTLTVNDGVVIDKGQQFFYEKIRPRCLLLGSFTVFSSCCFISFSVFVLYRLIHQKDWIGPYMTGVTE